MHVIMTVRMGSAFGADSIRSSVSSRGDFHTTRSLPCLWSSDRLQSKELIHALRESIPRPSVASLREDSRLLPRHAASGDPVMAVAGYTAHAQDRYRLEKLSGPDQRPEDDRRQRDEDADQRPPRGLPRHLLRTRLAAHLAAH